MANPQTYSFLDVQAAIEGPGGAFSIGSSSGVAEEGISAEFIEEKDKMSAGADGVAMHSLNAASMGKISVRLLKTSPVNALLAALYNFQAVSATVWGQNTITVADTARGDFITGIGCAFTKLPKLVYGKEGPMNEWEFNVGNLTYLLGTGTPAAGG